MKKRGRECGKIHTVCQNEKDPVILFFDQATGHRKMANIDYICQSQLQSFDLLSANFHPFSPIVSTFNIILAIKNVVSYLVQVFWATDILFSH